MTLTLNAPGSPLISYLGGKGQAPVIGTGTGVSSGSFEAQAPGPFDNSSLSGSYVLHTVAAPASASALEWGMVTSAGSGRLEGSESGVGPKGTGLPVRSFSAGYTVSASGRARMGSGKMVLYFISPSRAVLVDLRPGKTDATIAEIQK